MTAISTTEFHVCYQQAKRLRTLAKCDQERAAIERLHLFHGTEIDLRLAASIYERAGEGTLAVELLAMAG